MPDQIPQSPPINPVPADNSSRNEKIIGYFLLIIGLIIIVSSTFYAVFILTGKTKPAKVFNVKAPEIPIPSASQTLDLSSLENSGIPSQILDSLKPAKQTQPTAIKIIPDEVFSDLINMFVAYILVMILASTGSKFASIGIQLIKEIKVQVKN